MGYTICTGCGKTGKRRFFGVLPKDWDYFYDRVESVAMCPECLWKANHQRILEKYGDVFIAQHGKPSRPVAHWILNCGKYPTCSNCRFSFNDVYDVDNFDRYCRHCGAEMAGLINEKRKP